MSYLWKDERFCKTSIWLLLIFVVSYVLTFFLLRVLVSFSMHDNHEIDFELLNSDRSALFTSVYTDYQYVNDLCSFHRNSARIDIATGEVFATVPGNEGNWDLVQVESLPFTVPGFDHSASFYTYGFEWSESKVSFYIDLEDGVGHRALFEVLSDGSGGMNDHIPNMPAYTFFNTWHTC